MEPDTLARSVEHRRKVLGLTQPALAGLAGCSERFVHELESGKPTVRLDKEDAIRGGALPFGQQRTSDVAAELRYRLRRARG